MQVGEWKAHEYINEYYIHVISSTSPPPNPSTITTQIEWIDHG